MGKEERKIFEKGRRSERERENEKGEKKKKTTKKGRNESELEEISLLLSAELSFKVVL